MPTGEPHALFTEKCIKPLRKTVEKIRGGGRISCGADVGIGRFGLAVANILGGGRSEDDGVLGNEADPPTQLGGIDGGNVRAVDQDTTARGVVEAKKQLEDSGLAGTRRSYERNRVARLDCQGKIDERRPLRAGRIGESHLLDRNAACRRHCEGQGSRRRDNVRLDVQQL